jgi:glycosyltransferase involved in cell wall biosynthesis
MMKPKVSVLLSAYNEEGTISRTIESVLSQTRRDFEFVILDDGSADRTVQIIQEYEKKDSRIRFFQNEKNLGINRSTRKGIGICAGDYVAIIDAGDICHPARLEKQAEFLDKSPSIFIVGCYHRWIDEDGKVIGTYTFPVNPKDIRNHVFGFGAIAAHPCLMMRKELFGKVDAYDTKYVCIDYDLYMKTLAAGLSISTVPEYLVDVLRRGGGISLSKNKQAFIDMFKLRVRYLPKMFSFRNLVYTAMSSVLILVPAGLLRRIICSPLWSKNLRKVFLKG